MSEERDQGGATTFQGQPYFVMLAVAVVIILGMLGLAANRLFMADGGWGWWFLLGLGVVAGPGALIKFLSAAKARGDGETITGYAGKGFVTLRWSEVKSVRTVASRTLVSAEAGTIVINRAYLGNRPALDEYLADRCRAHGIESG